MSYYIIKQDHAGRIAMQKILSPNWSNFSSRKKPGDGKHAHVLMHCGDIMMRRLKKLLPPAVATKEQRPFWRIIRRRYALSREQVRLSQLPRHQHHEHGIEWFVLPERNRQWPDNPDCLICS